MYKKISLSVVALLLFSGSSFAQGQIIRPVEKALMGSKYLKLSEELLLKQNVTKIMPLVPMEQILLPTPAQQILHSPSMQAVSEQNIKNLQLRMEALSKLPKKSSRSEYFARLQAKNPVAPVKFEVFGEPGLIYAVEKKVEESTPFILKRSLDKLKSVFKTSKSKKVITTAGVKIDWFPFVEELPASHEKYTRDFIYHKVAKQLKEKEVVDVRDRNRILQASRAGVYNFMQLVDDAAYQDIPVEMTAKEFAQLMADVSFLGILGHSRDILPLISVLRAMPSELAPYADAIVGRSLISLKGHAGLNEIAALRASQGLLFGPFWRGVYIYNETFQLGLSLEKPTEDIFFDWNKYNHYFVEYSVLNTFNPYVQIPEWQAIYLQKIIK